MKWATPAGVQGACVDGTGSAGLLTALLNVKCRNWLKL